MFVKVTLSLLMISITLILYSLSNKKQFRNLLGVFGLFLSSVYIFWRIFYTLPDIRTFDFIFAFLLIFFETVALGQNVVLRLLFSKHEPVIVERTRPFIEKPTVDIIISTYNEPEDILKRTIVGCLNIDYPKGKLKIYMGDDGNRASIRELCEQYGINYMIRDNNEHAKAGNINNVLTKASGEFVLLLDADMIPKENIISVMLDYFEDESTGFVQSPQVFYNMDPFQYNLGVGTNIPNEQDFFMRTMQEKRAHFNAVLHVGTNALFRRTAIDRIGGIPTGSITEDMATGMLIQNEGYKSFFVRETLALGLTSENFQDLMKQRDRWCRGNTQVMKKYNPLTMKNLTFAQKLIYLDGFVYWMFGLQKMVYIISPLLFLLFRVVIFTADGLDLALVFLPHFISTSLYFKSIAGKERNTVWSHIYDTAMAPKLALSFASEFLLNRELKFNVTPKGTLKDKDEFNFSLASVHIFLFAASVLALVVNMNILLKWSAGVFLSGIIINIIWCVYNMAAVFISIFLSLEKKRLRKTERIPTSLSFKSLITSCKHHEKCGHCGTVTNFSEKGMLITLKEYCPNFDFNINKAVELSIESVGNVQGQIVRYEQNDSKYEVGVAFKGDDYNLISKANKFRFNMNNTYIKNPVIQSENQSIHDILLKVISNAKVHKNKNKRL
ncbi:MAG TPA: glycosyltransferase [Clostridia bacterium]|nr:glycosyltransferase [Clostridia bacterium]